MCNGAKASGTERMGPRREVTRRLLLTALLVLLPTSIHGHEGHEESPPCSATDNPLRLAAPFAPGTITVDGQASDWESIDGLESPLLQALGASAGQPEAYPQGTGSLTIKAAHDGQTIFFLLKIPGAYVYTPGNHHLAVSAALMFGIGDDATLYNMGGCPQPPGKCSAETCRNHEVDLLHFEVDAAIPGRQYGRNLLDLLSGTGADRIGNLSDGFGFNPHCKQVDHPPEGSSVGRAENDWTGVWSHSAITTTYGLLPTDSPYATSGEAGNFIFEFSRPLRTLDLYQQDVQFQIGGQHRLGVAIWYPLDSQPWQDHQHYIISCDWTVLSLAPAPVPLYGWSYASGAQSVSTTTATALSSLALLLSLAAVFVSIVVGWWVRANHRQFESIDNL